MQTNIVKIKIVNTGTNPLPAYATAGSSGMDLRAWLPDGAVTLAPMERRLIPTGLRLEIPKGFEAQIRPRSGWALRQGITVLNTPGTIDSDYRGEVGVILINLGLETVTVSNGDRICQMVVAPVSEVVWRENASAGTEALSDTERGEGGFGHTGI